MYIPHDRNLNLKHQFRVDLRGVALQESVKTRKLK